MGTIINQSYGIGLVLSNPADNPVSIAAGVTIGGVQSYAILGSDAAAWQVTNSGTLRSHGTGVDLQAGGTVNNTTSGLISGGRFGVSISGASGVVSNTGNITASQYYKITNGSAYRSGSYGIGVALRDGGTVSNGIGAPGATIIGASVGVDISGGAGTVSNFGAIDGRSSYADYAYSRYPSGYTARGVNGVGVQLEDGGTIVNGSSARGGASASIYGGRYGISISGAAGVVSNYGTVTGYSLVRGFRYLLSLGSGIVLADGGTLTNAASGVIQGYTVAVEVGAAAGTVTNFGIIRDLPTGYVGDGVDLGAGGTVMNGSATAAGSAAIYAGFNGVSIGGEPGFVGNYGKIIASGYVYNPLPSTGVNLTAGGKVVNGSSLVTGATIYGHRYGVSITGGIGTIGNDGTIGSSGTQIGARLGAGGKVNNGFGGIGSALIQSYGIGVDITGGAATVINAGTIEGATGVAFGSGVGSATLANYGTIIGTGGTAVNFGTAAALLQLHAGATFSGTVIASSATANVIELAKGAAGSFGGLGSSLLGFGTVEVDAHASWTLTGTNTAPGALGVSLGTASVLDVGGTLGVGDGLSLSGSGELSVLSSGAVRIGAAGTGASGAFTVDAGAGGTVSGTGVIRDSGPIVDNGVIIASGGSLTLQGGVSGTGMVEISPHAVLTATGELAGVGIKFLPGGNGTLQLDTPSLVSATFTRFVHGDKIDLVNTVATATTFSTATDVLSVTGAGGTIAALHFSGSYPGQSFHLASDGHGGTNITLA